MRLQKFKGIEKKILPLTVVKVDCSVLGGGKTEGVEAQAKIKATIFVPKALAKSLVFKLVVWG